jgi:two-component system, chemotaxis family, chemotaxis protein CheY
MWTCLVVDDSSVTRRIARSILERMGFHVLEADDGEKALAICRCVLPEAILLDWNMPVMDGYEFLGELLDLPGGDKPRVVFCTTESNVAQRARALQAGAYEYITKPFDSDLVAAKFRAAGLFTFTVFPGAGAASFLDS